MSGAEAPVDIGGRLPGPPASSPGGGLQTGTAGPKARGIAFGYLQAWRSSERRPPVGIAERSEAKPHSVREPTAALTSPRRDAINTGCALLGDAGQRRAPRCLRHTQYARSLRLFHIRPEARKNEPELRLGKEGRHPVFPDSHPTEDSPMPRAAHAPQPPAQKPPTKPAPPGADRPPPSPDAPTRKRPRRAPSSSPCSTQALTRGWPILRKSDCTP